MTTISMQFNIMIGKSLFPTHVLYLQYSFPFIVVFIGNFLLDLKKKYKKHKIQKNARVLVIFISFWRNTLAINYAFNDKMSKKIIIENGFSLKI